VLLLPCSVVIVTLKAQFPRGLKKKPIGIGSVGVVTGFASPLLHGLVHVGPLERRPIMTSKAEIASGGGKEVLLA
jgi:hypothetical protein